MCSIRDVKTLTEAGLLSESDEKVRLPGNEVTPCPDPGWQVMFVAFLFRGLSIPAHEFLCVLLFIYGVQLQQLTPNAILHIACFITPMSAFEESTFTFCASFGCS
jgi:hypothetical protein